MDTFNSSQKLLFPPFHAVQILNVDGTGFSDSLLYRGNY